MAEQGGRPLLVLLGVLCLLLSSVKGTINCVTPHAPFLADLPFTGNEGSTTGTLVLSNFFTSTEGFSSLALEATTMTSGVDILFNSTAVLKSLSPGAVIGPGNSFDKLAGNLGFTYDVVDHPKQTPFQPAHAIFGLWDTTTFIYGFFAL